MLWRWSAIALKMLSHFEIEPNLLFPSQTSRSKSFLLQINSRKFAIPRKSACKLMWIQFCNEIVFHLYTGSHKITHFTTDNTAHTNVLILSFYQEVCVCVISHFSSLIRDRLFSIRCIKMVFNSKFMCVRVRVRATTKSKGSQSTTSFL